MIASLIKFTMCRVKRMLLSAAEHLRQNYIFGKINIDDFMSYIIDVMKRLDTLSIYGNINRKTNGYSLLPKFKKIS